MNSSIIPGEQLDHYRIDSVLTEGRAAITFRATDLRTNRPVAIEIPHPEIEADLVLLERFQHADEAGPKLEHPGLVKLIEKRGREPNHPQPYLVMESFAGESLRQLLKRGKLPQDRAARIAAAICGVLEYIHGRGVVHGDLAPEHVLVDSNDRVKLIHFGVASKAGARRLTFTKLSQLVANSPYVSPEEVAGKRPTAQSDVYSVGVMLYEMVTGVLPFPAADPTERLTGYPIPPREIDPSISPALQEVIYRALEREPKNRYAKAHDFAHDLAHLNQVGVADRPELRLWKKKNASPLRKVLLYAALVLIPIVIIVLLVYVAR